MGAASVPEHRQERPPEEYEAIAAEHRRARRRSTIAKAAVGVVTLLLIIAAIAYSLTPQPQYLHNNETCSISGYGVSGTAECGGKFLGGFIGVTSINSPSQEYYYYIQDSFLLNSAGSFTIQFSASAPLGVSLIHTLDGSVVFSVNQTSLQPTTYQLAPGNYTTTMTNYNAQTVNFTITDYVK